MQASDERFGAEVYDALAALGRRDALTARMDYAGIQALKAASRSECLELFRGSGEHVMAFLERGAPGEFAAYLCGVADGRRTTGRDLLFLGAMLWI